MKYNIKPKLKKNFNQACSDNIHSIKITVPFVTSDITPLVSLPPSLVVAVSGGGNSIMIPAGALALTMFML